MSGIGEMDKTFLPESFKGNHKKSGFAMPKKSRKRSKQVKKGGSVCQLNELKKIIKSNGQTQE